MALFLFLLSQPSFPVDVLQPVLNMEMELFFFLEETDYDSVFLECNAQTFIIRVLI